MFRKHVLAILVVIVALGASAPFATSAMDNPPQRSFGARLHGFDEVPSISTAGHGRFAAKLSADGASLAFRLQLEDLSSPVTQAHIHFGESRTNGGVMVLLCRAELDDSAPPAPPCVGDDGAISGVITPESVVGPEQQGIGPGQFREFLRALAGRAAYVNVHTVRVPSGEIRGQIR